MNKKILVFAITLISITTALISVAGLVSATTTTLLGPSVAAVDCTDAGQLCDKTADFPISLTAAAPITVNYIVSTKHCSSVKIHVLVDGVEKGASGFMGWKNHGGEGPMAADIAIPTVAAGNHTIGLQAEGKVSGCNTGILGNWRGTVSITANIPASTPASNLSASCTASPASITTGQSATFISNVLGGSGNYTYLWSGACTGSGSTCNNVFSNYGTQNAGLTVTSGTQTATANCSVGVGQINNVCTYHSYQRCDGGSNLYWYDSCGARQDVSQYCPNGCVNNSCQNYNNNYGTLNVSKTVRNLTSGNSNWSSSAYANPSDMLMFMITLQNSGNQNVQNVFVRDMLPANLIYNNQLVVACTNGNNCNNSNYNYSGNITSGINLNTIYAGQTVTITYQVQVAGVQNFAYGTTTLTNSVSATSSNSGYNPASNATVVVTRSTVLGASTVSTGLTNNFWLDSFFLPLLLTLVGVWMWRSGMFFGIEKWLDNKKKIRRGFKAEKELSTRIAKLQKTGK